MKRRVMIGTPTYARSVTIEYAASLIQTLKTTQHDIFPLFTGGLVNAVRNEMVKIALDSNMDDLLFIDDDIGWEPESVNRILNWDLPVVGATYRYKNDKETYMFRHLGEHLEIDSKGLMKVHGLPGGFLRLRRDALQKCWDVAQPYRHDDLGEVRDVFRMYVQDGTMWGEDFGFCNLWMEHGGELWLDAGIKLGHVGRKVYYGDLWKHFMEQSLQP